MRISLTILAVLVSACGRQTRYSMDGTWRRGGVSGDHFGIIVLAIRDAGDEISGTACRTSSSRQL